MAHAFLQLGQGFYRARHNGIAAQEQIGFACGDARGVNFVGAGGNLHMAEHRATFLRQTCHVEHGHAFLLQMRRHAEQSTHGNHTRAAHTRNHNAVSMIEFGQDRLGQGRHIKLLLAHFGLAQLRAI